MIVRPPPLPPAGPPGLSRRARIALIVSVLAMIGVVVTALIVVSNSPGGLTSLASLATLVDREPPPRLKPPALYETSLVRFHYPSNWKIDRDETRAEYGSVSLETANGSAIEVMVATPEIDLATWLDETVAEFRAENTMRPTIAFTTWGRFRGTGQAYCGTVSFREIYTLRTFLCTNTPRAFSVIETVREGDLDPVHRGFTFIADSLEFPQPPK